jgi:hypothetical protein
MAQAAKKKLVVCGGNGFLGIAVVQICHLELELRLTHARIPHLQSRSSPRMGRDFDLVRCHPIAYEFPVSS